MNRKIRKTVVFAAVILCVGGVTAYAASSPPQVGVKKGSENGVNRAVGVEGALKANAVGNRQIKLGSVSCGKLSADLAAALCNGKPGTPGTPGAPGANGIAGSPGKNGDTGDHGNTGATGSNGSNGSKGDKGDPGVNTTAAQYGVAQVLIMRHSTSTASTAPPVGTPITSAWATYSTLLGSPVGDNTGGIFRFTCSTGNAPCEISVHAKVTGTDHRFYPRLLVYRQDYNAPGPEVYCEYADGSTGSAPTNVTSSDALVPVNIGGSADCGGPVATAGDVSVITVPAGYYDVQSTFVFKP